jgi:hypothetical protein
MMIILLSQIAVFGNDSSIEGMEVNDITRASGIPDGIWIIPAPNTELGIQQIRTSIRIQFPKNINISTFGFAVEIEGEGVKGNLTFIDGRTVEYVPEWGFIFGKDVDVGIPGGEEGLRYLNGEKALDEDLRFGYFFKHPNNHLLEVGYEGMITNLGNISVIEEDGTILYTSTCDSTGMFPLPDFYTKDYYLLFDNGHEIAEFRTTTFGSLDGPTFIYSDHFAITDLPPLLIIGNYRPKANNLTIEFSHLMDRESVISNFDGDGLEGDFEWTGRFMFFTPSNIEDDRDYTVRIGTGARSVYGPNLTDEITIPITTLKEDPPDRTMNLIVLGILILIVVILIAFLFYQNKRWREGKPFLPGNIRKSDKAKGRPDEKVGTSPGGDDSRRRRRYKPKKSKKKRLEERLSSERI